MMDNEGHKRKRYHVPTVLWYDMMPRNAKAVVQN